MSRNHARLPSYLHSSFKDAIFFNLMVGMGESYLVAFALALGMGEMQSGLVAVVPLLLGATVQLFAGIGVRVFSSKRYWISSCAFLQGVSLIALAQLPRWNLQGDFRSLVVFGLASVYWGCGLSAGPTWNLWIAQIVPREHRIQFFARRARVSQFSIIVGLVTAGIYLEQIKYSPQYLQHFAYIFLAAGMFRIISSAFIAIQDEQNRVSNETKTGSLRGMGEEMRSLWQNASLVRMICYLFTVNIAMYICAPYFSPYMLKQLNLGFIEYTTLIATSFFSRIIANDLFVFLARTHGVRSLLIVGVIGIAPTPLMWTFSESFLYLVMLQIIGGFCWGCHELGVTLYLLEKHGEAERGMILTVANFFNSIAMLSGGLIGAQILRQGTVSVEAYHLVFALSTCARCIPIVFLFFIESGRVRIDRIFMRVLSLRPTGSIVRPIVLGERRDDKF